MRKNSPLSVCSVSLLFLGMVFCSTGHAQIVANYSFETPNEGPGGLQYKPTIAQQGGAGWTFNGATGIAQNGSAFGEPNAPDGVQVAFLQTPTSGTSDFSQAINFTNTGAFTLSLDAAARVHGDGSYDGNPFEVTIDGTPLSFGGQSTILPPSTTSYTQYASDPVLLAAGSHVVDFVGLGAAGSDLTSFIDDVQITSAVPEPSTWAAAVLALGTLVVQVFRAARFNRAAKTQ